MQCDFIIGSDAEGCMVVLVGDVDNRTISLTRNSYVCATGIIDISRWPFSCYRELFAFDIESDGSVGAMAVPGELVQNNTVDNHKICTTDLDRTKG